MRVGWRVMASTVLPVTERERQRSISLSGAGAVDRWRARGRAASPAVSYVRLWDGI